MYYIEGLRVGRSTLAISWFWELKLSKVAFENENSFNPNETSSDKKSEQKDDSSIAIKGQKTKKKKTKDTENVENNENDDNIFGEKISKNSSAKYASIW